MVKILYVEDDEFISLLAKRIFIDTPHDLVICPDPKTAKIILDHGDIGLVILDMVFPDSDGVEVLEYITKRKINVYVVIYSGFPDNFKEQILHYKNKGVIHSVYNKTVESLEEIITVINKM
jgi:DNA-binding NtrC family response regulator